MAIRSWAWWPVCSLTISVTFGNIVTRGFPVLVGVVPLIATFGIETLIRRRRLP